MTGFEKQQVHGKGVGMCIKDVIWGGGKGTIDG